MDALYLRCCLLVQSKLRFNERVSNLAHFWWQISLVNLQDCPVKPNSPAHYNTSGFEYNKKARRILENLWYPAPHLHFKNSALVPLLY